MRISGGDEDWIECAASADYTARNASVAKRSAQPNDAGDCDRCACGDFRFFRYLIHFKTAQRGEKEPDPRSKKRPALATRVRPSAFTEVGVGRITQASHETEPTARRPTSYIPRGGDL
jgi:hypothetical protein